VGVARGILCGNRHHHPLWPLTFSPQARVRCYPAGMLIDLTGDPELDAIAVRLDAIVRQLADMGLEFDNVGQLLAAGAAVSPDIRERLKALTTRH
jgi:hypothetical protein